MNGAIEKTWLDALSRWAVSVPSINKAWVFGSRAKGTFNKESDLDIAVELKPDDREVLVDWIFSAEKWRCEAQVAVGVFPNVDLQLADGENDEIVRPAVEDHGILFYEKGTP